MPPYPAEQSNKRNRRIADVLIAALVLLCAWLLVLTRIGYGHVAFVVPANSQLQINGHVVSSRDIKMRSGSYDIILRTPAYNEFHGTLTLKDFQHLTYQPSLKPRSVNAIASSVVGSYATYGPPILGNVTWFDNNSWLAAMMGPGSAQGIVLHFADGSWHMAYAQGSKSYPSDLSKLPSIVSAYMQKVEAQNAGN